MLPERKRNPAVLVNAALNRLAVRIAPQVRDKLVAVMLRELDRHVIEIVVPQVTDAVRAALDDHITREIVVPQVTNAVCTALDDHITAIIQSILQKDMTNQVLPKVHFFTDADSEKYRPILEKLTKYALSLPAPTKPAASAADLRVHFLQTADAEKYRPILELTSQTVLEYCRRHGFTYEAYVGVVRGYHPWQASYNRIPLLHRIANSGYAGWVCYMDADAYIADLNFDLADYLKNKSDIAIILAPGGPEVEWWNVNDGTFLINLAHPKARFIVDGWNNLFNEVSEEELRSRVEWYPENHDQTLLWYVMQAVPDLQHYVVIDAVDATADRVINYRDARFIRQALRALGDLDARLKLVESEVRAALST